MVASRNAVALPNAGQQHRHCGPFEEAGLDLTVAPHLPMSLCALETTGHVPRTRSFGGAF